MVYLTGDTHGDFQRISSFCDRFATNVEDILIVLGDAGINFDNGRHDKMVKEFIKNLPITIFAIQGNHDLRPHHVAGYKKVNWFHGTVYMQDEYPNILFGIDGEIYDFEGKQTIVIGGAYSVDKYYRLQNNMEWFDDEQPSEEIKQRVEEKLNTVDWKVDVVLTHTTPKKYQPIESFMQAMDQSKVDTSTEDWLDAIEDKLDYKQWYSGHFHVDKTIDRLKILFNSYDAL